MQEAWYDGSIFLTCPPKKFWFVRGYMRAFCKSLYWEYTWQHVASFLPNRQGISWPNSLRSITSRRRFPMATNYCYFPKPMNPFDMLMHVISFQIFHTRLFTPCAGIAFADVDFWSSNPLWGTCPRFLKTIWRLGQKKVPCSLGIGRAMDWSLQSIVLKNSARKYRSSLDQTPLVWTCLSSWVVKAKKLKQELFSMANVTPLYIYVHTFASMYPYTYIYNVHMYALPCW